jgi:hypothetical protein
MAEPTSAYSVYDLVLMVAKAAKIAYYGSDAQQEAMVPVNYHDFERCLRVVNNGIKQFIHDAPADGWKWQEQDASITFGIVETTGTVDSGDATTLVDAALTTTYATDDLINGYYVYDLTKQIQAVVTDYTALTGTVAVAAWLDYYGNASSLTPAAGDSFSITDVKTVEGDKSRYFLPDNFGEVAGEIEYARQSNVGHITWTDPTEIRRAYATTTSLGNPIRAAVKSYRRRLWELRTFPSPTAAKTVEFPYRVGFDGLKALSGTASGGSATTLVDSSFANVYPDDYFNGQFITTLDGTTGRNGYAVVTDFTGATCTFTVADWLSNSDKTTAAATDPDDGTSYFVTDDIRHPAGQMFDVAIKSAIMAEAAEEFGPLQYNAVGKYLEIDLPRAHALDARMRPRKTGVMQPGNPRGRVFNGRHHPRRHRSWTDVTYG